METLLFCVESWALQHGGLQSRPAIVSQHLQYESSALAPLSLLGVIEGTCALTSFKRLRTLDEMCSSGALLLTVTRCTNLVCERRPERLEESRRASFNVANKSGSTRTRSTTSEREDRVTLSSIGWKSAGKNVRRGSGRVQRWAQRQACAWPCARPRGQLRRTGASSNTTLSQKVLSDTFLATVCERDQKGDLNKVSSAWPMMALTRSSCKGNCVSRSLHWFPETPSLNWRRLREWRLFLQDISRRCF